MQETTQKDRVASAWSQPLRHREVHGTPGVGNDVVLEALGELMRAEPPATGELSRLCAHLAELLQARSVAVAALDDDGQPWLLAGAEDKARELCAAQFDLGEGPCIDAGELGSLVWARCADATARWPAWTPRAIDCAVEGVISIPVNGSEPRRYPLGTLWMAFDETEWIADDRVRLALTAVSIALRQLSWFRELQQRREQVRQLEHALESRILIEQAKGYLAAELGTTPDKAFERLRRTARSSQRRLHDVAGEALRTGAAAVSAPREATQPLSSAASAARPPQARL